MVGPQQFAENEATVAFNGTDRIYGMKSFVGLTYDRDGAGLAGNTVNDLLRLRDADYRSGCATPAPATDGYVRVVAQRVRTDFKAQNLELNFIRFPMCNTGCSTG